MALGMNLDSGGGGDIVPIIKFDAKSGDFVTVDKHKDADGTWQKQEQELQTPFTMVAYMDDIEVGWANFTNGRPDFRMTKIGEPQIPDPSTEDMQFKQAFRVRLQNKALGLREFSSQSKLVIRAFDDLHNQYMSGKDANPGKVPAVEISGTKTETINTQQGALKFKVPVWTITQWVDAPAQDSAPADSAPAAIPAAPIETGSDLF